jgi:hypothetical protein
MRVEYVPLLGVLRDVYRRPRGRERFRAYLRTFVTADGTDVDLVPLTAANPMAKEHVAALVDALLAADADGRAAAAAAAAAAGYPDLPGTYRAGLAVCDDRAGGWTNRWACELRFRSPRPGERRFWITPAAWSSEPADAGAVARAAAAAVHRTAYVLRHGPAVTLRDLLAQEGYALAAAGFDGPTLDPEEAAYTRYVLADHLDATDPRTLIECLFGDPAGATLGFTPRGLSLWAGVALAVTDRRAGTMVPGGGERAFAGESGTA